MAVPLVEEKAAVGALILTNKRGRHPEFTPEDEELLQDLGRQAVRALRNARQHEAEKKVEELDALLTVSREITATLDLDKVQEFVAQARGALENLPAATRREVEPVRYIPFDQRTPDRQYRDLLGRILEQGEQTPNRQGPPIPHAPNPTTLSSGPKRPSCRRLTSATVPARPGSRARSESGSTRGAAAPSRWRRPRRPLGAWA